MRYKSRFDNPKFMERRARVLARYPSVRLCYPWCTPEDEAHFYATIGRGTEKYGITFTRPGGFPPVAAEAEPKAQTPPQAKPRRVSKRGRARKSPDGK